jgi:hypothetical protein
MNPLVALLSVAILLVACKRRTTASPEPVPVPPAKPAAATGIPAPAPAAAGSTGIVAGDQNLPVLNSALKAYLAKHKQGPAKLEDLAKEGFIAFVPMAPPGGRYELNPQRSEVRLVPSAAK